MTAVQTVTVTLPRDLVDALRVRVRRGEFKDLSEAVCRELASEDEPVVDDELRQWLRGEGLPAYDAYTRGEDDVLTEDQVRSHLAARRARHG